MKKFYFASTLILLLTACDVFDKEETIPGYVVINNIELQTTEATEGANTHNIVDATVFADGEFVGTYELPAIIPILKNGNTELNISGGIKNNGLSDNRVIYPFYNFVLKDLNLLPDVKTPVSPDTSVTVEYFDTNLKFEIEDFENIGLQLEPEDEDNAEIEVISAPPENVSRGQSLEITLTPSNNVFYRRTAFDLNNLPKGSAMYLEIDYKGSVPLEVGIFTEDAPGVKAFAGGINPTDEWTKVYFELTNEIARQTQNEQFEIYLESRSSSTSTEKLYIDNIKFIYP